MYSYTNADKVYVECLESRRLLSSGALDNSFGAAGVLRIQNTKIVVVDNAVAQSDGKTLIVSYNMEGGVTRLLSNGKVDRSYGTNGTAILTNTDTDIINTAIVQPDGKLIIVGNMLGTNNYFRGFVARLTARGKWDTTFGTKGKYIYENSGGAIADSIAIGNGKIAVGGSIGNSATIIELHDDGTIDTNFGAEGVAGITNNEAFGSMSIGKDGKVTALTGDSFKTTPIRWTASGKLDKTFSSDGIGSSLPLHDTNVFVHDDGSVLIAGSEDRPGKLAATELARYTRRGDVDKSFGNKGILNIGVPDSQGLVGAFRQADGDWIFTGVVSPTHDAAQTHIFAAETDSAGKLLDSFGDHGVKVISPDAVNNAYAMSVTPQNKILIAGDGQTRVNAPDSTPEVFRVLLS